MVEVNDAARSWVKVGCSSLAEPHVVVPVNLQVGVEEDAVLLST